METIARIRSDFTSGFGIPRQSCLTGLISEVILEKEYRRPEAVRGLEGFSHIWLIWKFDTPGRSLTVRPPRLGGNKRMGVFATRSPFRPNPIGLSSVKLEQIVYGEPLSPILVVSGADLKNGTQILDIKPYLPYTDSHPQASSGFSKTGLDHILTVNFPDELLQKLPCEKRSGLIKTLSLDPRPSYHDDPSRIYGFQFCGFDIKFFVCENELTVADVVLIV